MQSVFDNHVAEEQFELYSMGKLPETEVASLEEHLLVCHSCQDRLREVDLYIANMKAAARAIRQEPPSFWETFQNQVSLLFTLHKPALGVALATAAVLAVIVAHPWQQSTSQLAPATVVLQAFRGDGNLSVPAGRTLELELGSAGLPSATHYRVELASSTGSQLWESTIPSTLSPLRAYVNQKLDPGRYWVRVYNADDSSLLREFELRLK